MNVMYLCDDNYAWIAGISILSLLETNQNEDCINIFIVGDGILQENSEKLHFIVNKYNRKLIILSKPDIKKLLGVKVDLHWWIENVFSRIFLGEVFKDYPEVDRLIYIDCDTLVVGSLGDLWNCSLGNDLAAGVCEAMGYLHKKAIGLRREEEYFNAGMFLVDLKKWKRFDIDNEAREFVKKNRGKFEYADESILNGTLHGRIKKLPPKYNLTSLSIYLSSKEVKIYRKPFNHYSEEERQESLSDPRIIHFTSTFLDSRPWVIGSKHPYRDEWLRYLSISPWRSRELSKDGRSKLKLLASIIASKMPDFIRYEVTGFIHAYIKPLKYVL